MAGILNINSNYNIKSDKIKGKVAFEIGQIFAARIISLEETGQDVLLKLLDGWQFSAKLEKNLEFIPEGLVKFKVEGFEDGKIKLKIVKQEIQEEIIQDSSIENLLKNENLNVKKENYELLREMVKRDIPLTKENITTVISIENFKENASKDENYINTFIDKYLSNKNINPNSMEGKSAIENLKTFFNKLIKLDSKEIMTFIENNIELTSENIDSFKKIFTEEGTSIYNIIKESSISAEDSIVEKLNTFKANNMSKEFENGNILNLVKDDSTASKLEEPENMIQNLISNTEKDIKSDYIESNKSINNIKMDDNLNLKDNNIKIDESLNLKDNNTKMDDGLNLKDNNIKIDESSNLKNNDIKMENRSSLKNTDDNLNLKDTNIKEIEVENLIVENDKNIQEKLNKGTNFKNRDIEMISEKIKSDIDIKHKEIKNIISSIIQNIKDENTLSDGKIFGFLNQHINDFKVFNSVSNQYYYMDVPINVDNSNYECKLIIKDERKKGKKIDSKSVKIAASINTKNMGEVDAFIGVNNINMDIVIKCPQEFINLLKNNINKVSESLMNLNYNICITVDKKEEKFDIINCRDFFNDNFLYNINARA